MIVVSRFSAAEPDLLDRLRTALAALASGPGYLGGRIGRAVDDPSAWVLVTEWEGVGAYRRALSSYDAKLHAHPVLALAHHEPNAYEVLYADRPGAEPVASESGRAADADVVGLGEASGPGVPRG